MRWSKVASSFALALAFASTAAATGCSKGDPALDAVRAASAKTISADSAKVSITVVTDAGGKPATLTAQGAYDLGDARGLLALDLGSLLAGITLDARIEGDTAYVATPAIAAGIVGKPFLKVDLAALATQNPKFGPLTSTANPGASVDALRGAKAAEKIGVEDVRGEATTHYRGTLDLGAARAKVDGRSSAGLTRLSALLGTDTVPFDVWLDGSGQVRRSTLAVPAASSRSAQTTVTTELYEYGAAVEVVVPPADQVGDGNALLGSFAGG